MRCMLPDCARVKGQILICSELHALATCHVLPWYRDRYVGARRGVLSAVCQAYSTVKIHVESCKPVLAVLGPAIDWL